MAFEVTVHIPALDRLVDALNAGAGVPAAKPAAEKPKAETKPSKPAAEKPKAEPKNDEPVTQDEGADGVDYGALRDEAKKLLQEINKNNGIDAVRGALSELGVANIGAVADEDLERAIEVFNTKLG